MRKGTTQVQCGPVLFYLLGHAENTRETSPMETSESLLSYSESFGSYTFHNFSIFWGTLKNTTEECPSPASG